jgi:transposase
MTGNNPTDRSKLGAKRHILTDKNGIPLSAVITSASTHGIKAVTDVMDNMIIKRSSSPSAKCNQSRKRKIQHLCLDKACNSKTVQQAIIKQGHVPHIPYKRSRGQKIEAVCQKKYPSAKNRRWVVERTNSWHNRYRKLFTRYEKKVGNYLGLVQLSCSIIIYRKIILG